jgi:hypothetical protein
MAVSCGACDCGRFSAFVGQLANRGNSAIGTRSRLGAVVVDAAAANEQRICCGKNLRA